MAVHLLMVYPAVYQHYKHNTMVIYLKSKGSIIQD